MIKANELRIGNWYIGASRGEYEQVDANVIYHLANNKMNCLPIPLTPEILERCGFEYIEEAYGFADKNHIIYESIKHGFVIHPFCTNDEHLQLPIQYLHQLQNLIYSLTQTEITIKK